MEERERERRDNSGSSCPPVTPSQKKGVGGSGRLRSNLGGHAHQGLRHRHRGWDPRTHTHVRAHTTDSASRHSRHRTTHWRHPSQGHHGNRLSRQGGERHGLDHAAAKASGHGADPHLVEGRRSWLAHLEGVGMGCWSRYT